MQLLLRQGLETFDALRENHAMFPPNRIVCLTEETVETLYLLGEQDRIVGISGYVVRPPQARREKPRVSAFTSADVDKVIALKPDLVLSFSDLQADIVADLIRRGIAVHAFNQRSILDILSMVKLLGAMVGAGPRAQLLAEQFEGRLAATYEIARKNHQRPRVFFEEWDNPLISGIKWVSELVEIAGGVDIFPDQSSSHAARGRIVTIDDVISREPDIIIGSWCGKKFRPSMVAARPGFGAVPAVRNNQLHEIKSSIILQPGPAALTDGLTQLVSIISNWRQMGTNDSA